MFDVRFASGRMLEVIDGSTGNRQMSVTLGGVRYPVTVAWEIASPPDDGRLLLGSMPIAGSGSTTIGDPSVRAVTLSFEAGRALPDGYSLEPNYPNPFNSSTLIQYAVPLPGRVTLRVYDLLGREVRTLVDGEAAAGEHTAFWDGTAGDGSAAPSGVFLLNLHAGEYSLARKVLLIR
jgi:hypothetical protein